jgi:peptidoglycan/LPS O-acetylase OafA/YrhL
MTTSQSEASVSEIIHPQSTISPKNSATNSPITVETSPDSKARDSKGKLDYIDALRGLACLSILVYHLSSRLYSAGVDIPTSLEPFIRFTYYGVPLFFIVSSFTLYLSLDKKRSEKKRFTKFYLRRLFRIAPLFYAVLAIYLVRDFFLNISPSGLEVLENILFIFNFSPSYFHSVVDTGWTIGVEMLFYIWMPLIFVAVKSLRGALAFFVLTFAISKIPGLMFPDVFTGQFAAMSFFTNLPVFAVGVACYLAYKHYIPRVPGQYKAVGSALLLISSATVFYALVTYLTFEVNSMLPGGLKISQVIWEALGFSLLLLSLSLIPNRLMVNRVSRFYGKISYSIYLVHPLLIFPLTPIYGQIAQSGLPIMVSLTICLLMSLMIATPVAMLTYRFIESPGIVYGKKIISRL